MPAPIGRHGGPHFSSLGRAASFVLLSLAVMCTTLHCVPHVAFDYSAGEGRFVLHSDRPISAAEVRELRVAERRIRACEFDDPGVRHEVFLCHDAARFAFFAGLRHRSFGVTNALGFSYVRAGTKRSLASLIAHERTHALVAWRYGVLAPLVIEGWKEEGICEYVAGEITYDVERGKALLRAGRRGHSSAFRYFTYWLAVRHLVEVEGLTLSEVIDCERSEDDVLREAVEALEEE